MPFIRMEAAKLSIDGDAYLKRLDAQTRDHFYGMVAAFLRAVVPKVPVWTGMARASLVPLAKYLTNKTGHRVEVDISPEPDSIKHQMKGQNIAAGIDRGDFEFIKREGVYILRFNPSVEHYKYLDENESSVPLRHPTPWHSFQTGREAALEYREYIKTHFPRIKLKVSKVSIGTSRRI